MATPPWEIFWMSSVLMSGEEHELLVVVAVAAALLERAQHVLR